MNNIELHDLKRRLTALAKSVAEITKIVEAHALLDPVDAETVLIDSRPVDLPELRMMAAYMVREVSGGKEALLGALELCKAKSVTTLFEETPEHCPKFVALLERACDKTLAQVTSRVTK